MFITITIKCQMSQLGCKIVSKMNPQD